MIPTHLRTLFWDTNIEGFRPAEYPDYTISRVLEYGNEAAIGWMRDIFSESEIRRVLRTDRRLTRRSANFWALVYKIPAEDVAALKDNR
jgi:hypothetical protein